MADVILAATIEAGATLATILKAYRIDSFSYSGTLEDGSTLEIDGENLTVEKDGTISYAGFSGVIFDVLPGVNVLTYEDSEGSRTIRIAVVRNDRHIPS